MNLEDLKEWHLRRWHEFEQILQNAKPVDQPTERANRNFHMRACDALAEAQVIIGRETMVPRIPMILFCPGLVNRAGHAAPVVCAARHIDKGDFATKEHHTHSCQECGFTWRPAVVATVGVQFLPGFKDEA